MVASVRPLHPLPARAAGGAALPRSDSPPAARSRPAATARPQTAKPVRPGTTLDGTWDRRLGKGLVRPDMIVDLHGHNLAAAHHLLDVRLQQAIGSGARLLLLITGKPPAGEPPVARGRIRAAVGDWLGASRHAGSIAAVRGAHPRHGGAGALYIILRRKK